MTVFKWDQTASDNDNADSTINWTEGQAPSTVNNSARSMMAAVAKLRDDISGNLLTAGSSTAYTVTTNQVFTSLTDGLFFCARIDEVSGTDPTLAVDGLTAKQIESVYGTNVKSGALRAGAVHWFTYDLTADAWIVAGFPEVNMETADYADIVAIEAVSGTGIARRTAADTWSLDDGTVAANFIIGDGIATITTGIKGDFVIPFAGTITEVWLLGDASGSIVVDLWKDSYANHAATDSDSITASAVPTISGATKSKDVTLTGWTTAITADDIFRVNVDSITTLKRCTLVLVIERYT